MAKFYVFEQGEKKQMASPQILQLWREDPHRAGVSVKWDARETKRSINTINHSINKSKCHDLILALHIS